MSLPRDIFYDLVVNLRRKSQEIGLPMLVRAFSPSWKNNAGKSEVKIRLTYREMEMQRISRLPNERRDFKKRLACSWFCHAERLEMMKVFVMPLHEPE